MRVPRLVLTLLAITASSIGSLPPVSHASSACPDETFCAGSASADITPPVTTPMWGYTAREGGFVVGDSAQSAGTTLSKGDVQGAANTMANDQFVRDKAAGDTEGYGKTFEHNQGIHLRLFANAFVLRGTNGVKVAIVQTDLGGVPGEVHQAVANRLATAGIDRDHLMIGATHTHHGPGGIFQYQGYALLGGDEFDTRVFEAVVAGITKAVATANQRLSPARLATGVVTTPYDCERQGSGCANRNRRVFAQWCMNPENSCSPRPDGRKEWSGSGDPPSDPLYNVIRVDRADGVPLGVITNFAAHGTIGGDDNLLFSGDNQGWTTRLVQRGIKDAYGAPLPPGVEIVDALVNGAQGDQSPIGDAGPWSWGPVNGRYAAMEDAGRRQARAVVDAWKALGSQLHGDVSVDARFEFLCFCGQKVDAPYVYDGPAIDKSDPMWDRVAPYASLGSGGIVGSDGTSSPIGFPAQGRKSPVLGGVGTNPSITRMQLLRIDRTVFGGIPGEPTVTAGRRVAKALLALPGRSELYDRVAIAGLANDYDSYFATPEEYTAYQYEGSFTLFGPQSTPLLTQELARLAERMIAGLAVPDCTVPAAEFCATHPTHPDTTAVATTPQPTTPDLPPRALDFDRCTCARGEIPAFTWLGGSPSAEWRPGADRVQLQRLEPDGGFVTVAGDAHDAETILRYEKTPNGHRWTTLWDIPFDASPGIYRFHIEGAYSGGAGIRYPYSFDSERFDVSPAILFRSVVASTPTSYTVRGTYPPPFPLASYRYHPRDVTAGTVTFTIEHSNGNLETLQHPVDPSGATTVSLTPGDVVRDVEIVDSWGNHTA